MPGNGNWSIESFEVETFFWYCSIYKSQYFHRQGVNASFFLSFKFLLKCLHSIITVSNMDFFDLRIVQGRYKSDLNKTIFFKNQKFLKRNFYIWHSVFSSKMILMWRKSLHSKTVFFLEKKKPFYTALLARWLWCKIWQKRNHAFLKTCTFYSLAKEYDMWSEYQCV